MPANKPTAFEQLEFGGVDTRSNPLNMPRKRMLRALNWVPRDAGNLELRWGYSTITVSTVNNSAIHTLIPYTTWNPQTRYVIRFQGTTPYQVKVSDGTVTSPTVRGAAFSSSAKGSYYQVAGRLHYGNGTDQKWFDGTTWRNNGLRALTDAEVANVIVAYGVPEFGAAQNASITVTAAAGGSFSASSSGFLFYVSQFDPTANEIGPATVNAGSGRVTVAANQKVTLASLPDNTGNGQYKLVSRTGDGLSAAYFCTNTSTAITSCSRSGSTLTVVSAAHGLSTNDIVVLTGTTNFDSVYIITKVDNNTFTATLFQAVGQNTTGANTTGGTCKRIVSAAPATLSVDVTSPAQDTSILANDTNRGLAITSSEVTSPGYQFYLSIYNPNGGGHIGNRVAIVGGRISNASLRFNVRISGLPDLSGTDSEWSIIIGRTGDGAEVPYLSADSAGNFFFTASGQTSITLTTQGALAQSTAGQGTEMPIRNGIIPSTCDKFAVVGDYVYAADSISATIRRSASQVSQNSGSYAGRVEQSWAPDDIDTFPPNDVPTCIAEVDLELFVASLTDCAIANDQAGVILWRGPWTKGCAGKRAFCKTDHGFFWVSGDKELCTFENGLPLAISEEYEAGELALIGDAFLSTTELVYHRDAALGIDHIEINGQKSDGTPHTVIHDFRVADDRSAFGQGYGWEFTGPLSSAFTFCHLLDGNGHRQVWAGATNGQIYQLHTGSDDAGSGNQFTADGIFLINSGADRLGVPYIDWYGDSNVVVSVQKSLKASLDANSEFAFVPVTPTDDVPESVQGYEDSFLYRAQLGDSGVDLLKTYLRFQLTSHSADGSLALNSPPHVPLEDYGRIYEVIPSVGQARER